VDGKSRVGSGHGLKTQAVEANCPMTRGCQPARPIVACAGNSKSSIANLHRMPRRVRRWGRRLRRLVIFFLCFGSQTHVLPTPLQQRRSHKAGTFIS
jgi:hypothetical protein